MNKHTYILKEGVWRATGQFYDEYNNCYTLDAETKTTHYDEEWIHEGTMKICSPKPMEISNKYEIIPYINNKYFTNWVQFNQTLGIIAGKFMVLEDTILSSYRSETGEFTGSEVLIQVSDVKYINRGIAFRGNERLSCWTAELYKQKE